MTQVLGVVLRSVVLVVASSGAAAVEEEGKIYECTDTKGQVVYQGEPCLEVVRTPSPAVPRARPRSPELTPPKRPVDARWATPEKTLKTFVGAVRAGDRPLVLACLTSSALASLGPDADAIPLEKLKETVSSFVGYVAEGDLGPFWSIRAKRAGLRPKWIFFEQTAAGEWKIAAI